MDSAVGLCGLQDCEHSGSATEVKQTATVGGDMLVVTSAGTEKGAELTVSSTEPLGRTECLEAPHTSDPAFDTPVILLESIILVGAGTVLHVSAQR